MGKKKGFKKVKGATVDKLKSAVSSEDEDDIETRLESILDDEIDQYNAFKEKDLLEKGKGKGRGGKRDEGDSEEEEVYGLDLSSDEEDGKAGAGAVLQESDEDEEDDDEDILGGQDEDYGVPDSRAWGKKARVYHDTDYVDKDFGGFEGSDAEMAEQEEAEAKEIQKRLTAELDEADFLGLIPAVSTSQKKAAKEKEVLKVDYDSMSMSEKRKLIQRECPEVVHLLDERKERLKEAEVIKKEMEKQSNSFLKDFYTTKYHTILNYCINISYFLYLRATKPSNCKGHPVIKRILQYRRLLDELNTFNPKKYVKSLREKKTKKEMKTKKKPKSILKAPVEQDQALEEQMNQEQNHSSGEESESDVHEKRAINYTIAKNKGLTPYRKKELRNPRVKHRMKFRKATVRRKGQVRKPRTEVRKYEGERTGIKMNVTKSIKLK